MEASRYDFTTRLGLDYEPLGAPESESRLLKIGSRNDLSGFLVEFDLPGQWLTAVGGGGVCGVFKGCQARHGNGRGEWSDYRLMTIPGCTDISRSKSTRSAIHFQAFVSTVISF